MPVPNIRITDHLYRRLEALASGFDTPARVIERLLDEHHPLQDENLVPALAATPPRKPKLIFYPQDEAAFKELLLESQQAHVRLHKKDGTAEFKTWDASRFTTTSNLRANLWSGYLRGWADRGIVKAEFAIDPKDLE